MPHLESGGYKIYFEEYRGEGSDLPLVVFLHGFNSSLSSLVRTASSKTNRFDSLLIDLPNHGLSSGLKEPDWGGFKEGFRAIYEGLKLRERDRIYLVGHSLGGALSLTWLELFTNTQAALLVTPLTPYSGFSEGEAGGLRRLLLPTTLEEATHTLLTLIPGDLEWAEEVRLLAPHLLAVTDRKREILGKIVDRIILDRLFLEGELSRLYSEFRAKIRLISAQNDLFLFGPAIAELRERFGIVACELKGAGHGCFRGNSHLFSMIINNLVEGRRIEEGVSLSLT